MPTEEQIEAALNAYMRTEHEQNGVKREYVEVSLDDWSPQIITRMRAALRAAEEAG